MDGCPFYDQYNECCMWERMEKLHNYRRMDLALMEEEMKFRKSLEAEK